MNPRIIGVIDLLHGVAVRAVGGRRDEYRPVCSRLCDASDPRRIAAAYRARYGIEDLYVADLDAILGHGSNAAVITDLARDGFRLAVDAGLRTVDDVERILATEAATIVAGLETLASPAVLAELVAQAGRHRLAFSLDLVGGVPMGDPAVWGESRWNAGSPLRLARQAAGLGVEHLIVLDLSAVGGNAGSVTESLCRQIHVAVPRQRLWTGGGVRTVSEAQRLASTGVDGVLVASALHAETF
ncbi:MAG: HisA/HisF-related TIM barrel protein [Planctomycetaceae bacterium]